MTIKAVSARVGTVAGGAVLLLGLAAAPALAYPPGTPLVVSGSNGVITVTNGQPGCTVTVTDNGTEVGSKTLDADGTATFNGNTSPGTKLVATVSGAGCEAETATETIPGNVTPTPTPTPTPSPTPSHTGSNTALGLAAGIGALGVGGGLVVASRRKKV